MREGVYTAGRPQPGGFGSVRTAPGHSPRKAPSRRAQVRLGTLQRPLVLSPAMPPTGCSFPVSLPSSGASRAGCPSCGPPLREMRSPQTFLRVKNSSGPGLVTSLRNSLMLLKSTLYGPNREPLGVLCRLRFVQRKPTAGSPHYSFGKGREGDEGQVIQVL